MTKLSEFVDPNQSLLMPAGPVVERGRGCWNCLYWDVDAAKARWNEKRLGHLSMALQYKQTATSLTGKMAEAMKSKSVGLAMMVERVDEGMRGSTFGLCKKGSFEQPDDPQPLIQYQNLCRKWNGRDGSSLATSGHPIDLLPEELNELHQPKPDPKIIAAAKAEAEETAAREAIKLKRVIE